MTGIAEFLTARLDEDEATAQHSGPARVAWLTFLDDAGHMRYTTVAASNDDDDPWVADGHELVAPAAVRVVYDPAHVLAEVKAKRRILAAIEAGDAEWAQAQAAARPGPVSFDLARTRSLQRELADVVLRNLAAPYADHPDYDPAWRVPTTEENDHG